MTRRAATDCFYKGGLFHYFEGGAHSKLFAKRKHAATLSDGETCNDGGRYCKRSAELDFWYPCREEPASSTDSSHSDRTPYKHPNGHHNSSNTAHTGCYFGRGPLQLSWNSHYGLFQHFLKTQGIDVDLLGEPNLLVTQLNPPLALLSALWFYMTPQPPKPSMHDIVVGNWIPTEAQRQAGYNGSVFGPTSLVINNECEGEEKDSGSDSGHAMAGESRRIKAFRWFCEKLGVDAGQEGTLSCKGMPDAFDTLHHKALSWQPDWSNMWKSEPCDCAPASYPGALPYYDPDIYHPAEKWEEENERNRLRCVYGLYQQPEMYRLDEKNSPCLAHTVKLRLARWGLQGEFGGG